MQTQPPSNLNFPKNHPLTTAKGISTFRSSLLAWYDKHGRDLPWRQQTSLYKTVVSEFMLQQTRVATVLPYFESWLEQFPDFAALAASPEETAVKAWEGLGYYSRARNLRRLAQQIVNLDEIPSDSKSWESYPGVGPYVAAAVTSINFGTKVAVVDGNVVRVLARMLSIEKEFRDNATAQRKLRPIAQKLLRSDRPGDYNQAVMELGATICHRRSPICSVCPVLSFCQAGQRGDSENYPRIARKKIERVNLDRLWITRENSLLLRQIPPDSKRLAGLMELPRPEDFPILLQPKKNTLLATKKRSISNQAVEERIYHANLPKKWASEDSAALRFVPIEDLEEVTLSAPHRRWVQELAAKERSS